MEGQSSERDGARISRNMSATSLTLTPAFHAQMRRLQPTSAIFNLVSTIMGGGVLSLPYAIQKTGVVLGIVMILLCAAISDFSVYILVAAARKAGAESYEGLAMHVGGMKAKFIVISLVFSLTWLCCVAYIVLAGELITESIGAFHSVNLGDPTTKLYSMTGGVLFVLPLCFLDQLHALRYTSFVSIISVVVLTLAIMVRSIQDGEGLKYPARIKWAPDSVGDVVYALPFYCVAYLCHFNVLPMHCELRRPTRKRMKKVIHYTMGIPAILYVLAGLFGYLYSLDQTCDSILKNFGAKDPFIIAGRFGLTFTILFSFPLIVLPCRDSFNRLLLGATVWYRSSKSKSHSGTRQRETLRQPLIDQVDQNVENDDTFYILDEDDGDQRQEIGDEIACESEEDYGTMEAQVKAKLLGSVTLRIITTLGLVGSALYVAYAVPGISVIWSLMGSTVSLFIAFILPTWFYLATKQASLWQSRNKALAAVLLVFAIIAAVLCTVEAFLHVNDVTCNIHPELVNSTATTFGF